MKTYILLILMSIIDDEKYVLGTVRLGNALMSSHRVSHLSHKSVCSGSPHETFRWHISFNRILALTVTGVAHPNGS